MDEEILETAKSICACGAEDEALLKRLCAASAQALERELLRVGQPLPPGGNGSFDD